MTRVAAPSRLHFGLLSLLAATVERWPGFGDGPGSPARTFGGVGLMIDTPGVAVTVRPAAEWRAEGPSAERALPFARRFMETTVPVSRRPFHILVERCPPEHTGLGTGTALALAVAQALAVDTGSGPYSGPELARRVGRGERSAVGLHGFERGGLIVEAGKRSGDNLSPLLARYEFPAEWRIVVVQPAAPGPWHGVRERQAFGQLHGPPDAGPTDVLCRLVLLGMLPALVEKDCAAFGAALYEFNARVGEAFAPVQGGIYASPAVAELIAYFRSAGVHGVGQSSWGPAVFAVVPDGDRARDLARHAGRRFASDAVCLIAQANATGAHVETIG